MISKWYEYKNQAIKLRRGGKSIREIEINLKIPRSTLSGWFKNIKLTKLQKEKLEIKSKLALIKARKSAIIWHNSQKEQRVTEARNHAQSVVKMINIQDKFTLELALAMLYWGEGSKNKRTSLGNSNPNILNFFLLSLAILYGIDRSKLKCELHLRSDQNEEEVKKYWSTQLMIPIENFSFTKDKRTAKSKTYSTYKGVCVIECGKINILRRLSFIVEEYCNEQKFIFHGKIFPHQVG